MNFLKLQLISIGIYIKYYHEYHGMKGLDPYPSSLDDLRKFNNRIQIEYLVRRIPSSTAALLRIKVHIYMNCALNFMKCSKFHACHMICMNIFVAMISYY